MKTNTHSQQLYLAGAFIFSKRKTVMRDIFYTCIIMLMSILIASAQPSYVYAKQFSGPSNVMGYSIAMDDSGNVYTTGSFEGTVDFDPGAGTYTLTAAGASDIYISKLDAAGDFVWCKQISGGGAVATSISVDGTKNVYFSGTFNGTTDFNPDFLVYNLTSFAPSAFVCKLSSTGDFIWAKQLGGNSGFTNVTALDVNEEGVVWIAGYFSDTTDVNPGLEDSNLVAAGPRDIFVCRMTTMGELEWAVKMGGDGVDAPSDIVVDKSENVILTGGFSDTADFDPGNGVMNLIAAGGPLDIFVCKLKNDGSLVWAKAMGGASSETGLSVDVDNCDNVYTTGIFEGSVDFDPSNNSFLINTQGMTDIFISKLNSSGSMVWTKAVGSSGFDVGGAIMVDINGDVYVGGRFTNAVDFDPGSGTTTLTSAGLEDCFVSKYNALGEMLCAGSMGGSGTDVLSAMIVNPKDHVFSTGYFSTVADFDPTMATANLTVAGSYDAFVSRLGPGTCCNPIPDPVDAIANSPSLCMGESSKLNVVPAEMGTCPTWYWYPDNCGGPIVATGDTITLTPTSTTTYYVRAIGACDTTSCAQVTVIVKPKPTANFHPNVELKCDAIEVTLSNYSSNADQYFWVFTGGQVSLMQNPKHTFDYDEPVSIELTAIHSSGCKDVYTWTNNFYAFKYNFDISVPNIFTPNNDGVNDEFTIKYKGLIADCFNITIYDRWGTEMYTSNSPDFRWDGKNGLGTKVKAGTYFYVVQIQEEKFNGYFMLME